MIKFINKATGIIEEPHNEEVIKQYQKSKLYDVYVLGKVPVVAKKELPQEKIDLNSFTLKELKDRADKIGLSYKKRATKSELIELLSK